MTLRLAAGPVSTAKIAEHFIFRRGDRLHLAAEFSSVFFSRRIIRGEYFDLHYAPRHGSAESPRSGARLGLNVAKKMAHRAVVRNLVKRIARESFRCARPSLAPLDLVLRLSNRLTGMVDAERRKMLRGEVDRLMERLPK